MAVQKNRVSRSRRDKRRSHHRIAKPALSQDPLTGDIHLRHHVSPEGMYKGQQVIAEKGVVTDDES